MRIPALVSAIRDEEAAGNPTFIEGAPGIGKSEVIAQMCREDGFKMIDIRLALLNPVDLRGIPVVRGERVVWVPPVFLVNEPKVRFFLDEINAAPTAVQADAYQFVLDRRIGEWKMHPEARIIAAGNRMQDKAVVFEMPSALRNRFAIFGLEPNFDDFKEWGLNNGIHASILSFHQYFNRSNQTQLNNPYGLLFYFDPKEHSRGNFPTPRQWEKVSHLLKVNPKRQYDIEVLRGHLGELAAVEFASFCKVYKHLPNIDGIISGKVKPRPPQSPDAKIAFCGALTGALIQTDKSKRVRATANVAAYCVERFNNDAEFAVFTLKDYCRTQAFKDIFRDAISTKEWQLFTKEFGELLGA